MEIIGQNRPAGGIRLNNEPEKKKLSTKKLIICCTIFLFFYGFALSYFITGTKYNYTEYQKLSEQKTTQKMEREIFGKNVFSGDEQTIVRFTSMYLKCGHKVQKDEKLDPSLYGKNLDDIKKFYDDYTFYSTLDHNILFERTVDSFCDKHYIAKLDGYTITIYHQNNLSNIYKTIQVNRNNYTEDDIKLLEEGIELNGDAALVSFLEDFTS